MEPFKALTFLAATAVVSLAGCGAAGFYLGYSAGRGNLEEIKAQIGNAPVAVAGPGGGAVSLKPVLEDIRALSKQVEALAAVKAEPAASSGTDVKPVVDEIKTLAREVEGLRTAQTSRPVLDEIKALAREVEGLRAGQPSRPAENHATAAAASGPDYSGALQDIRNQVQALNTQFEKQEAKEPNYSGALQEIHSQVQALNARLERQEAREPKAPKALIDEIRSLSASVQTMEPNTRRAVAEEVHTAVTAIQNAEPKVPRALMEEVRNISANVRPQAPQPSVSDQIKVLAASIESLKARLSEEAPRRGGDSVAAEVAQLRQLVSVASDQFGKCQTHLASLASAGMPVQQSASASSTVAVSQGARQEPSTVVFYDNVMLKKDQEKQYDEIGVRLALQSVGARQVRVAVNRQGFGLAFGERKVFRSQDVECELNLMETNLNDSQARVSISCKR